MFGSRKKHNKRNEKKSWMFREEGWGRELLEEPLPPPPPPQGELLLASPRR